VSNRTSSKFYDMRCPQMRTETFVPASQSFYVGSLVGQDISSGLVKRWNDTSGASLRFKGISLSELTGDSSTKNLIVNTGGAKLLGVAVAGATVAGLPAYCASDNPDDLTITPTTNAKRIGMVNQFRSASDCDVELLTPGAYLGVLLP
jgi:hypothetical protein